jgi:chromatin assembly factor 1 subunit B
MQVYDLAWSPTGEYILAGSTDNVARVFTASDGKCIKEIVEHSHYVQGVAWDPMNEYIATQSSDRSMHVHKITSKGPGQLEIHAIGKNTRIQHQGNHTPRRRRTRHFRRESTAASDAESSTSEIMKDDMPLPPNQQPMTPSTPATTPSIPMPPPPVGSVITKIFVFQPTWVTRRPHSPRTLSFTNACPSCHPRCPFFGPSVGDGEVVRR